MFFQKLYNFFIKSQKTCFSVFASLSGLVGTMAIWIKNKIEKHTPFKYYEISNAFSISALTVIFMKVTLKLIFNLTLSFKFNICISLGGFLLGLFYYSTIKEILRKFLLFNLGQKLQFKRDTFSDIYYEEDLFRNLLKPDSKKSLNEYMATYKKQNWAYSFKEPSETFFNIFLREFCISLIYLRLFFLQQPKTFIFTKFFLGVILLSKEFFLSVNLFSLCLIFSRFLFFLSDDNEQEISESFTEIYKQTWANKDFEGQITQVSPTINNARIVFFWCTRYLSFEEYSKKLFCNTYDLYVQMHNLNYWDNCISKYEFLTIKKSNSLYLQLVLFFVFFIY